MHELQQQFASDAGEKSWESELRALCAAGDLSAAAGRLEAALVALDSDFGRMALAARPADIGLTGWEDLAEAVAMHEGEPVAGVTLAIANETDRAFEKGDTHRPFLMLGIYTDEHYDFSQAQPDDLLAEIAKGDGPAWAGWDEDIEVYLDVEGLDALNTALIHHKQRHHFREGAPADAPLRYVEYVLGCWWRAVLFHQAVASECAIHGLPGGVPVLTGMVEMRPELMLVHGQGAHRARPDREPGTASMLDVFAADMATRKPVEVVEDKELSGLDLRRRVTETVVANDTGNDTGDELPRPGFFARLFGRRAAR